MNGDGELISKNIIKHKEKVTKPMIIEYPINFLLKLLISLLLKIRSQDGEVSKQQLYGPVTKLTKRVIGIVTIPVKIRWIILYIL